MGNPLKRLVKARGLEQAAGVVNKSINEQYRLRQKRKDRERDLRKKRSRELALEAERLRRSAGA